MYFDLNVVVPVPAVTRPAAGDGKKAKGKGPQGPATIPVSFSPGQVAALEARIDLLVHCTRSHFLSRSNLLSYWLIFGVVGYSVLAFNQVAHKRVDPKTHANVLDGLLPQLRKREGVAFLKRLTIVLDEDSEKGFGLVSAYFTLQRAFPDRGAARRRATRRSSRPTTSSRSRRRRPRRSRSRASRTRSRRR
jgi:ribonuclease P/MRP protein subunit RPP1